VFGKRVAGSTADFSIRGGFRKEIPNRRLHSHSGRGISPFKPPDPSAPSPKRPEIPRNRSIDGVLIGLADENPSISLCPSRSGRENTFGRRPCRACRFPAGVQPRGVTGPAFPWAASRQHWVCQLKRGHIQLVPCMSAAKGADVLHTSVRPFAVRRNRVAVGHPHAGGGAIPGKQTSLS